MNKIKINFSNSHANYGFTIIELLIVIVVIGILATISIVSYAGLTQKATTLSLTSDLNNASGQLKLYRLKHGTYPTDFDGNNCPRNSELEPDTDYCLSLSPGNTIAYSSPSPQTFRLVNTKGAISYFTTEATTPAVVPPAVSCPSGFIPVPGSITYGTSDFCVMKYEASQVGSTTTPISQAGATPWVNISQNTANANSPNVAGCTGCHLISEAEYLTIIQNVLSVNTNWSNNTIGGTNFIYSGHTDTNPNNALASVPSGLDTNGYYGTGNTAPSYQRRTLTLTNGEVIWDLSGNVSEWTSGTVQSPTIQPGIAGAGLAWREWNTATTTGTLSINPFPSYGTPAAINWDEGTNRIGRLYSNSDETGKCGFIRSGSWDIGSNAGVSSLGLVYAPSDTSNNVGFRVAR